MTEGFTLYSKASRSSSIATGQCMNSGGSHYARNRSSTYQNQMKPLPNTNALLGSKLALAMATTTGSPVRSIFANPSEQNLVKERRMAKRRPATKRKNRKFIAEMKSQGQELAALAARMNAAPDDEKMSLMAAIITRMIEQGAAMREKP